MENERKQKWVSVVFFSALTLFFVAAVLQIMLGPKDPAFHRSRGAVQAPQEQSAPEADNRIELTAGRAEVFGRLRLVYRGVHEDHLKFDVTVLDLDPDHPYAHRIPTKDARRRFRLADREFKLVSFGKSSISIQSAD